MIGRVIGLAVARHLPPQSGLAPALPRSLQTQHFPSRGLHDHFHPAIALQIGHYRRAGRGKCLTTPLVQHSRGPLQRQHLTGKPTPLEIQQSRHPIVRHCGCLQSHSGRTAHRPARSDASRAVAAQSDQHFTGPIRCECKEIAPPIAIHIAGRNCAQAVGGPGAHRQGQLI